MYFIIEETHLCNQYMMLLSQSVCSFITKTCMYFIFIDHEQYHIHVLSFKRRLHSYPGAVVTLTRLSRAPAILYGSDIYQSWRGEGQNEVYVANLHCSLGRLVSARALVQMYLFTSFANR